MSVLLADLVAVRAMSRQKRAVILTTQSIAYSHARYKL